MAGNSPHKGTVKGIIASSLRHVDLIRLTLASATNVVYTLKMLKD